MAVALVRKCPPPFSVVSVFPGEIPHPQIKAEVLAVTHVPVDRRVFAKTAVGKSREEGLYDFDHPPITLPVGTFSIWIEKKPDALKRFIVIVL